MATIKYLGKTWLEVGSADFIGSLPFGKTVAGNIGNNLARQLISAGFPSDENVRFISASKNITKRYLAGLASQSLSRKLHPYPRLARTREVQKRIEEMKAMQLKKQSEAKSQTLISSNKALDTSIKPKNKYTGEELEFALEIKIPSDVPLSIQKHNQNIRKIDNFVDGTAIIDTSSTKNVVLTQVQGRDTTRKEYISGGDINISVKGIIDSRNPDVYPKEAVSNFIALMQYAGVLEIKHYLLSTYNITHILVTNFSINPKEGYANIQPYSFSAVGIAPAKQVEYKLLEQEIVNANAITVNGWISNENLGTSKTKHSKLMKKVQKWL